MSPLQPLIRQLVRLRWYRWSVTVSAAVCALAIAALWGLLILFAADVLFKLPVSQRLAALALVVVTAAYLVRRHVRAGLRWPEDSLSLALLVERNHRLDSDLVAAMQFQSGGHGPEMGSPTLRQAVIDRASNLAKQLNFFRGVNAGALPGRALLLTVTLGITIALVVAAPGHARVFLRRLMMNRDHYPTRTHFQQVLINGRQVLDESDRTLTPEAAKCAEGRPVQMLVRLTGERPEQGMVELRSGAQEAGVDLARISLDDRLKRLQRARELLGDANPEVQLAADLCATDCPAAAEALRQPIPLVDEARRLVLDKLAAGPEQLPQDGDWYVADLPRHGATLRYVLAAGDARTEEGQVNMIPLPAISLHATAQAPAYSRLGEVQMSPGARQLRVLEGSRVDLSIACVNNKQLESAWAIVVQDGNDPLRLPLREDGSQWRLDPDGTPLAELRQRVQYSVQVKDADGLQLPVPVSGQMHIRPDRPPSGDASVLHRVVLPAAAPNIAIAASDDFGIRQLRLRMLIEKKQRAAAATAPGVTVDTSPGGTPTGREVVQTVRQFEAGQSPPLPLELEHALQLAPLQLVKGDRVKITLEIVDDRGHSPGAVYRAEPLVLEVSDEAGVLAAVSESDEQSERKLNELIKQQLGIGDSP